MLLGSSVCSVMALEENSVDKGESKIVAEVFDYGESVTSVVVDLGSVISADELKEDAFEVFENAANGDLLSKDLGAA